MEDRQKEKDGQDQNEHRKGGLPRSPDESFTKTAKSTCMMILSENMRKTLGIKYESYTMQPQVRQRNNMP